MDQIITMMKFVLFFISAQVLAVTLGCQVPQASKVQSSDQNSLLPTEVAGTWQAQDSPWKIVISPDGTISSAVVFMGEVEVKPNQTTKVEMKDGSFSTYKAGTCSVEYNPSTRELFVSIELEKIHIVFLDNVIDGNSVDRFIGPISEDGKTWMADWISVFDYGPRFPQEPNDIYPQPLIFQKFEN
jgi:hypothetical protein